VVKERKNLPSSKPVTNGDTSIAVQVVAEEGKKKSDAKPAYIKVREELLQEKGGRAIPFQNTVIAQGIWL